MTEKEVDRYAGELQRHGVESVEREVSWLSDLINAERNGPHAQPHHQHQPTAPQKRPEDTHAAPAPSGDQREGKRTPWVRFE